MLNKIYSLKTSSYIILLTLIMYDMSKSAETRAKRPRLYYVESGSELLYINFISFYNFVKRVKNPWP